MEIVFWILVGFFLSLVIRGVIESAPRRITKDELMAMVDEQFVDEYNKYRAEALRRAK